MIPRDINLIQTIHPVIGAQSLVKRIIAVILLLAASCAVAVLAFEMGLLDGLLNRMTLFSVRTIRIDAEPPLDEVRVRSWLPEVIGRSLLALRAATIVDRIQEKPWVENVSVRKVFPDSIEIQVSTKKPLVLGIIRGESYLLGPDGKVIEKATRSHGSAGLPVVTLSEGSDWANNLWVSIIESIPEAWKHNVSEYVFDRFPYFRILLNAPRWTVSLSAENWMQQLPRLEEIVVAAPSQLREVRMVNLEIVKKAVVSRTVSK